MKINSKKVTSIALATLIAIGSTSAFAAGFKDVSKGYWAKSYIERGKELGLLNGFEDGTFKPAENISRVQTLSLAARLLQPSQSDKDKAKSKYGDQLLKKGVKSWAIEEIAVAVNEGIISIDSKALTSLYNSNGAESLSSREESIIYLAKAMGLQKEVDSLGKNIELPFKDKNKITEGAKPYVFVMNKYDIISGDDLNNFNPTNAITRAEMSKLLSLSHDYIKNNKTEENKVKTVTGTLVDKFTSGVRNYVVIENTQGSRQTYEVNAQSTIRVNGSTTSYSDLSVNLKINAEVIEDSNSSIGVIKSLNSDYTTEKYTGSVYDYNTFSKNLTIEYKENNIINRKAFVVDYNAKVLLNGKTASLTDLRKNDDIKIEVTNGKITNIDAEARIRDIEGKLKEINIDRMYISVEDKDGNKENYDLDKDVTVRRNGRRSELKELRKGDAVEIRIEDKIVTEIEAEVVKTKIEGVVKGKSISYDKREITILNNKTQKQETYSISNDVNIEIDGKRSKLDDLELGYYVEVNLEGEEVVHLDAKVVSLSDEHIGRITYAKSRSYFEMMLDGGKIVEVIIDTEDIRDKSGKVLSYRDLEEGDRVLVTGELYKDEIVATEILRLSKGK